MRKEFTDNVNGINARIERYREVVPVVKKVLEEFESEVIEVSIKLDSANVTLKDSCDEARWLLACLNNKLSITKPCYIRTYSYGTSSGTDYNIKWGKD